MTKTLAALSHAGIDAERYRALVAHQRPSDVALRAALFVFELAAYRIDKRLSAHRRGSRRSAL